jgi:hypothetical protein
VNYILQRAEEEGDDVYRKAEKIVKEGKMRGSLTLKDLERGRGRWQEARSEGHGRRCRGCGEQKRQKVAKD